MYICKIHEICRSYQKLSWICKVHKVALRYIKIITVNFSANILNTRAILGATVPSFAKSFEAVPSPTKYAISKKKNLYSICISHLFNRTVTTSNKKQQQYNELNLERRKALWVYTLWSLQKSLTAALSQTLCNKK